jgi:hypothetical protein
VRRRVAVIAALAALAAFPGHGRAAGAADRNGILVQAVFTRAGLPLVVANFSNGRARPRWSVCRPPDTAICVPTRHRVLLRPGREPAGTVFRAVARYRGRRYVARTAPWGGTVHALARPSLAGDAVAGGTVRPVAGRWSGGWPGDLSLLRVEACRTRRGRRCVTLMSTFWQHPGPHRRVAVARRYAGWFLFAFDERLARDTAFGEPGYGSPGAIPPLVTSRTVVRSAPALRVAG